MDYELLSEVIHEFVKMEKEPVAIKVYDDEEDAKEELPKFNGEAKHCQLVSDASTKKESYYATVNEIICKNGQLALGLVDKKVDVLPQLPPVKAAIGYAPLCDVKFTPDVILIYAMPSQAYKIAQLFKTKCKTRFVANFNGTASLCADAVSYPIVEGKSNMTLGCMGSRNASDIKDEEMVIALTLPDAEAIFL